VVKVIRFGAFLRSTLSWWRSARISASSEARDRKSPTMRRSIARFAVCASGIKFTTWTGLAKAYLAGAVIHVETLLLFTRARDAIDRTDKETLLHILSFAASIIGMLESRFRKRHESRGVGLSPLFPVGFKACLEL
jgi:hypothetical protein